MLFKFACFLSFAFGLAAQDLEFFSMPMGTLKSRAESGEAVAQFHLGRRLIWFGNDQEGTRWCQKAAGAGDAGGLACLAQAQYIGVGIAVDRAAAIQNVQSALARKHPFAHTALGTMLQSDGKLAEAVDAYSKGAANGDPGGKLSLARLYLNRQYPASNLAQGVQLLREAASSGHAMAMYELGGLYRDGQIIAADKVIAVDRFLASAAAGYVRALYEAARIYENDKDLKNPTEALELYRKAASAGLADAQYHLGMLYFGGLLVEENDSTAASWLSLAAAQGHLEAQHTLGLAYRHGRGVSQDDDEASRLFRAAGGMGHYRSMYWLGWLGLRNLGKGPKGWKAHYWLERAAREGNLRHAKLELGVAHIRGIEDATNFAAAAKWLLQVQDEELAKALLGLMYIHGEGVEPDLAKGRQLLEEVQSSNDGEVVGLARFGLDKLARAEASAKIEREQRATSVGGIFAVIAAAGLLGAIFSDDGKGRAANPDDENRRRAAQAEREAKVREVERRRVQDRFLCNAQGGQYYESTFPSTGFCVPK